jgi:hypothetical protein
MAARATGSGHLLWPQGTTIESAPADFIVALDQAITITNWLDNLSSDELPPRWMWHLDWELEIHFEKVKAERDKKYGLNTTQGDDWVENEYAARFRK